MVDLPMKRGRELDGITAVAKCLMFLSGQNAGAFSTATMSNGAAAVPARVFECKTCNRQFPSFQALGGHRASHKRPRMMGDLSLPPPSSSPPKPKTHECSVCGLEFAIGQALGGHMRRHRAAASVAAAMNSDSHSGSPENLSPQHHDAPAAESGGRRVLWLDLNLTPSENDFEFRFGKVAAHHQPAVVDCFL